MGLPHVILSYGLGRNFVDGHKKRKEKNMEKASMHKGKLGTERHNERDFDFERAGHIDASKTHLNVVKSFCPNDGSELAFYEERYRASLDVQNEKYAKKRNYERIRTMEEVYQTRQKRPTEEILQYSKNGGVEITKDVYDKIIEAYISKLNAWSAQHGNHFHVLKYATHYDEPNGMTHTHVRTIWDYIDENGNISIGQEEGMRQAGLEIPDLKKYQEDIAKAEAHRNKAETYVTEWKSNKPAAYSDKVAYDSEMKKYMSGIAAANRYNNRSITWTTMQRELWEDTLEEFGYDCDRVRTSKRKHQSVQEWDDEKLAEQAEMDRLKEQLAADIEQMKADAERKIDTETRQLCEMLYEMSKKKGYDEGVKAAEMRLSEIKRASEIAEYQRRQSELELRRQNDFIAKNQLIVQQIENSDRLLAEQNRLILQNRQTIKQQNETMKAVCKGNRNQFGGNIEKFMQNDLGV